MMNTEQVFSIVSAIAACQWLLLIVFPNRQLTQWLVKHFAVPLFLSLVYGIYIVSFFSIRGGGFGSMSELRTLFNNDNLLLAGWVHYLAFDLLIGFNISRSAAAAQVSR